MRRAQALFGEDIFQTDRELTMSSAYSGIGTIEQAAHQVCTGITGRRCRVTPVWALEKDTTCKAELVSWFHSLGYHRACVFGNLKDLVPQRWYSDLGFGKNADELPPSDLFEKGLQDTDVFTCSRSCAAHTGQLCQLRHTDIHVAGTTCVDHSSYGSCSGDEGRNVKFFLIWAALMKKVQPKLILHENVAGFGTTALCEVLGSLYT
jgi:site-specific DNA-cytosine methylase